KIAQSIAVLERVPDSLNRWIFCHGPDRQSDRERRSFAATFAVRRDAAAMRFGDVAHDRQSEAKAAVDARVRCLCLTERLEDVRQKLRFDSLTVVRHVDLHVRGRTPRRDLNAAFAWRELHGVG